MFSTSSTPSAYQRGAAFAAHFDAPLPRGLREEADRCRQTPSSPRTPRPPARCGSATGQCTDADRPASRLGPQARNYQATMAVGDRISTSTAAASGPVAALTAMLHERGIAVEMTAFHQMPAGDGTAHVHPRHRRRPRRMGDGLVGRPDQSALRAVIACANRLSAGLTGVSDQRSGRSTIGMPSIGTGMPP